MPRRHRFAAAIAAVAVAAVLLVTLTVAVVTHGDGAFAPAGTPAGAGASAGIGSDTGSNASEDSDMFPTIVFGDTVIERKEYVAALKAQHGAARLYFRQTYGVDPAEDGWDKAHDGEVPCRWLAVPSTNCDVGTPRTSSAWISGRWPTTPMRASSRAWRP